MKRTVFYLVLLFALLTLTGCANEEPPYFNLPTIESEYDFRVLYFSRGRNPAEVLGGDDGWLLHATERAWLQEHPENLNHSWWGRSFGPRPRLTCESLLIVNSIDELANINLPGYTEDFFENNYLVVLNLTMPFSHLTEVVHQVKADGTIVLRPRMSGGGHYGSPPSYRTIVIELDNRFRPSGFDIAFIDNPWMAQETAMSTVELEDVFPYDRFYWYVIDGLYYGILVNEDDGPFRFEPNRGVTQGEFITMLGRMHEYVNGAIRTSSVGLDMYYKWALETGVILQYEYWDFIPYEPINREQMVVILYRYLNIFDLWDYVRPRGGTLLDDFRDYHEISPWARGPINTFRNRFMGTSVSGYFRPQETISRTMALYMLVEICYAINK
ncbi:MAG: hypothetical protein FWC92_08580 [Defluviitaleaceae bacterium]|nr:hypothetical protein [Defluviitaleaceae bacterium]